MSDLIRRQDVDKAIRKICDLCGEDKKNNGVMCGACNLDSFVREFDDIPSAEPERTSKAIEHDASVTDTDGYIYHRTEYLCGACKKKVLGGDEYCSHCGCRLDWGEDIPMEYFESGGI